MSGARVAMCQAPGGRPAEQIWAPQVHVQAPVGPRREDVDVAGRSRHLRHDPAHRWYPEGRWSTAAATVAPPRYCRDVELRPSTDAPGEPLAPAATTDGGIGSGARLRADPAYERTWLDRRSWVDVVRGFVTEPDDLVAALTGRLRWSEGRLFRYDHWVDVPRLGAGYPLDRPPHPVLHDAHRTLQHRYGVRLAAPSVALYRNERDGVAFHRDRDMRWLDDTRIALLVVGERRPFLIRPRANRYAHELDAHGAMLDLAPGQGDLLVMGGGCQAGWEHSVPKVTHRVGPRLSVQWRWTSRTGRQERGGSFGAPLHYSRR